jgi:hypothetical protein
VEVRLTVLHQPELSCYLVVSVIPESVCLDLVAIFSVLGEQEVLGDVDVDPEGVAPVRPVPGRPPNLDRLIQELQRQQDNRIIQAGGAPLASPPPPGAMQSSYI